MTARIRHAICMGAFYPCADRFVTAGYKPLLTLPEMIALAGKVEGVSGVEMDFPSMFSDPATVRPYLANAGLSVSALEIDHYGDAKWRFGAATSSDPAVRRETVALSKAGMDAAAELGAPQINLWFGHDGWDYPLQADHAAYWERTVDAVREIAEYRSDIRVCIEYKPKEPRTHSFIANAGHALLLCEKVGLPNLGVNIDTGHGLMGWENLAHSAVLCAEHQRLFYFHMNDNYRDWDQDMIPGSVHVWETIELLYWLSRLEYDGWCSLDIYPYREDAFEACTESIRNLTALQQIAEELNGPEVIAMQQRNDAMGLVRLLRRRTLRTA